MMKRSDPGYFAAWRAAKRARGLPPGDPRHGTVNGHDNYGCSCEACREAHADKMGRWRQNR
jgi:hypothetical protein